MMICTKKEVSDCLEVHSSFKLPGTEAASFSQWYKKLGVGLNKMDYF